ncbi:hypothetical protein FOA52_008360 [Chlamydomonas sp. UWO 241]|nr:hypothetical protein FOA52_008360 [Chlamydomonas sp. UWO 241]
MKFSMAHLNIAHLGVPSGVCEIKTPLYRKLFLGFILACVMGISAAMVVCPPGESVRGDETDSVVNYSDNTWMLISSFLVLIMTPGIALFYGGLINGKNLVATIAVCILPMAIIPIMWSFIGYSLAFGVPATCTPSLGEMNCWYDFIGNPKDFGLMYNIGASPALGGNLSITTTAFFVFQCMFATITPAILLGSIADRVNFASLFIFLPLWHMGVYCPAAHMVWGGGMISQYGVIDFAGGIVVHMSSGWGALAAAIFLGPAKPHAHTPTNVPYVVIGATLLWFGWFGFNAGSALVSNSVAAHAFVNTNIAAGAAMLAWMLMDQIKGKKFRVSGMCLGIVVGLVGITPAAGFVNFGAAAIIGIFTAVLCSLAQAGMEKLRFAADDTLDVFACHGIGGTIGTFMTALFQAEAYGAWVDADGAFYGNPLELGKACLVIVCIAAYYVGATYVIMIITNFFISMRVTEEEEEEGLDFSKHYEGSPKGEEEEDA